MGEKPWFVSAASLSCLEGSYTASLFIQSLCQYYQLGNISCWLSGKQSTSNLRGKIQGAFCPEAMWPQSRVCAGLVGLADRGGRAGWPPGPGRAGRRGGPPHRPRASPPLARPTGSQPTAPGPTERPANPHLLIIPCFLLTLTFKATWKISRQGCGQGMRI